MFETFLKNDSKSKSEYQRQLDLCIQAIVNSLEDDKAYDGLSPEKLKQLVQNEAVLPENGFGFDEVLKKTSKMVLPYLLRSSSTDYMAHLHTSSLLECIAAELIISTFNQSMDSWDQSPVATEIELETINCLCKLYGYNSQSDGTFTSGGTQSNLSGLLLARDWFCCEKLDHDIRQNGLPLDFNKLRIYTSEISHFSMEKSAHLLGLGYNSVVKVPVNSAQQLDVGILERRIKSDIKAGFLPFCIITTQGTTDYGSLDNIGLIRKVCDEFEYGCTRLMERIGNVAKYNYKIAELSKCDSISDFTKCFLCR